MQVEMPQVFDEIDAARLFVHHMSLALAFYEATDLTAALEAIEGLTLEDDRFVLVRAFANALQVYYDRLEHAK